MKKLFCFFTLVFGLLIAGEVTIIDQDAQQFLARESVGTNPTYIGFSPVYAFIVNQDSSNVTAIDYKNFEKRTISVASNPVSCASGKFGTYVVSSGNPSRVTYFDSSYVPVDLGTIGINAKAIAVAYSYRIFIVNSGSNSVSVFDDSVNPPVFVTEIQVGPNPVAIDIGTTYAYVVCRGDNTVWPIRMNTLVPITPIATEGVDIVDVVTEFDTVYVLDKGGAKVICLNPTQIIKEFPVGPNPVAIKKFFNGPDRKNWVIVVNKDNGTFTPIDCTLCENGSNIEIGGSPSDAAAGFYLYFTDVTNNKVIPVDSSFNVLTPISVNNPGAIGMRGNGYVFVVDTP